MEGQRYETLKTMGFILQLTQPHHVIDAMMIVLDVSIKHRRVGAYAREVNLARHLHTLFHRECISPLLARLAVKGAKCAIPITDIGGIEMAVHIIKCGIAMTAAAHDVGYASQSSQIIAFV